jgi:tRNA A-37 threonylcarbamoyl transferase component Bud32
MLCPECNTENPNSNWYCDTCGSNLRETEPVRPQTKPEPGDKSAATAKATPSTTFAGRYRGPEKIGDGAMATVYRALDTELDEVVALKVLKSNFADDEDYIARFKREIALARSITHPNVYRIYDIGTSGNVQFISMEYIDGTELKKLITADRPSIEEGLELVRQICLALRQAHLKGIIHRDLKPHNIMVENGTGRCVVMDFGIAIGDQSSSITQAGAFVGTPEYISPEQAGSRPLDHTTDIYSLGVIMYELFTGRLPFGPGQPVAVAMQHIKETPLAPVRHNPEIGRRLESVVLKAMNKDPLKRYRDVGALLEDIESLLAGEEESDSGQEIAIARCNPYLNRNMIRDKKFFYGRRKEVMTIYSRIGSTRPQSVSIVGERRIGKSSLLYFINDPGNRLSYLDESTNYIFLFMDFQEKRRGTADEFFASLFDLLSNEAGERLGVLPEPGYDGFKQICERIDSEGMKLIMLFDEFEAITKNRNFEPEFFAFLRSLANNYNVAYVTSSVKNLQEMCHNREISDSPFFNIFSNLNLGPFNPREARKFVDEPSRECGIPLEENFQTILELGGHFPFYMAIACSILFDFDFAQADPSKTVLENIEEQFLEEAGMHFQFIIESLEADELEVFRKLTEGVPLELIDRFAIKSLLRRGYLIPGDSDREYRLFSRTLERMIEEHSYRRDNT